jgi:hypothetical protein
LKYLSSNRTSNPRALGRDVPSTSFSRRHFVTTLLAGGAALAVAPQMAKADPAIAKSTAAKSTELLDELQRRACLYFQEAADPKTGLVLDRMRIQGRETRAVASIAATGFGLSAMCIADDHGYLDRRAAKAQVLRTLDQLARETDHERGFFYHFVRASNGQRAWNCEASSIDTTWLLCGVMHCREYWADDSIKRLATEVIDRVDWNWMLRGSNTLCHGWTPEAGFLPHRWDSYAELLAMYLMAIGSNASPIPASSWDSWKRPMRDVDGVIYIDDETPLFVHQYSHAWLDFRGRRDRYANYFRNSQRATQAHRQFCMDLEPRFPWFGPNMWGVTASDSRTGYRAWGAAAAKIDGTLVPCAAGGSIAFLPDECQAVLHTMMDRYGKNVWSRYGFIDAFHPGAKWWGPDVLGIDLGIMLLMTENSRTNSVWNAMMSTPEIQRAMDAVNLVKA